MRVEKGAQLIARDILKEADRKSEEILSEARKQAQTILEEARSEMEKEEKQRIAEAQAKGQQVREEILAAGRLKARKELLKQKEELINEVFRRAEEELRSHVATKRYQLDLVRMAAEACKKLGSDQVVIKANPKDLRVLRKHKKKISSQGGRSIRIIFGEAIQTVGGVRVSTPDGKMEIDDTFEGRMKREFETLRVKIAKILFEGS